MEVAYETGGAITGDPASCSCFISDAPRSTRMKTFAWLSGKGWAIEQCFEEAKTNRGMDHYEVRKFPAWRRHMITTMLARFFLWHIGDQVGGKSTIHYGVAV
ncbi:MAG: hypothetical protein RBS58_10790 [Syntrophales bacterium]|nr:hypothetical protein [Syntrophales bacterium]